MLTLKTSKLIASTAVALALLASTAAAQDGKTMFGDDRKETLAAMKLIVKSVGAGKKGGCLYCHVKEGGKPNFATDTPHKQVARLMKTGFVDSLVTKGKMTLTLEEEEHRKSIVAEYRTGGDKPGIYLSTTVTPVGDKGQPTSAETVIALPKEGETVSCMTCHNKVLHFLTDAH